MTVDAARASVTPVAAIFNGPIRTSCRVDMQTVLASKYRAWEDLWEPGGALANSSWSGVSARMRSNKMVFDVDDYQGAGRSAYLAVAQLDGSALDAACAALGGLEVGAGVLRLYDFGIATLTVDATYREAESGDYGALLGDLEAASTRLASATEQWCAERVAEILEALPSRLLLPGESSEEGFGLAPSGVPMWMHRVLITNQAQSAPAAADSTEFLPHPCFVVGAHVRFYEHGHGEAWFGHGTSVVQFDGDARNAIGPVHRMMDLANAYWSGAQELGTLVLLRQRDLAAFRRLKNTRALEDQAYGIVDLHDELALFRALVNDQLNRLQQTDRMLFERIGDSWRFKDLLDEVDRRRSDLAEIHDQALRRIQADETGRLNVVVFGLTMISAAAVITDLVQFVQEQGFRSPDVWRSSLVAILAVALLLMAWQVAWGGSATRRRAARFRGSSLLLSDPSSSDR